MLKIISFKICPFVQRVTALLAAKKLPYEVEYIDLNDKPEWFLALSPNSQVPLLITESGVVLFESEAIIEYIDETSPLLEPKITPEQKALDRAWGYMASKHYLTQCSTMRSSEQSILVERQSKLNAVFQKAENGISVGPYFKGSAMSNVDIAWLPLLHRADIIRRHTGYDFLKSYPKVKRWQCALLEGTLVTDSVAADFETKFAEFYLSNATYLGGLRADVTMPTSCVSTGCC